MPEYFFAGCDWPQQNTPFMLGSMQILHANYQLSQRFNPKRTTTVVLQLAADTFSSFVNIKIVLAEKYGICRRKSLYVDCCPQKAFST